MPRVHRIASKRLIPRDQRVGPIELGMKFGLLTVLREGEPTGRFRTRRFYCRCDCGSGKEVLVTSGSLRSGNTTSCGCEWRNSITKHGAAKGYKMTPEYAVWVGMISRCTNPKTSGYHRYGGRGITVCQRWLDSFPAFLEDVGPRPAKGYQLDRKDNNAGYEPGNARWVTRKQNSRNREPCVMLSAFGRVQCVTAWAEEFNIPPESITRRIRQGWDVAKAVSTPVQRRQQNHHVPADCVLSLSQGDVWV